MHTRGEEEEEEGREAKQVMKSKSKPGISAMPIWIISTRASWKSLGYCISHAHSSATTLSLRLRKRRKCTRGSTAAGNSAAGATVGGRRRYARTSLKSVEDRTAGGGAESPDSMDAAVALLAVAVDATVAEVGTTVRHAASGEQWPGAEDEEEDEGEEWEWGSAASGATSCARSPQSAGDFLSSAKNSASSALGVWKCLKSSMKAVKKEECGSLRKSRATNWEREAKSMMEEGGEDADKPTTTHPASSADVNAYTIV